MSIAYKVLSTWWRLVLLCGLLVVPVVPAHAQANNTCATPTPQANLCKVIVKNNTRLGMLVTITYQTLPSGTFTIYGPAVLFPGRNVEIDAVSVSYLRVDNAIDFGEMWLPIEPSREASFLILREDTVVTVNYSATNERFSFEYSTP